MNIQTSFPVLVAMLLSATVLAGDKVGQVAMQVPVEIAVGRGERGPWRQNESRYDYVDDPTVGIDGGRNFTPPDLVPGSVEPDAYNGSQQGLLMKKLAVNRDGGVAIVNSSLKQGKRCRVWLIQGKLTEHE